jgi:putative lipoic acid-binding regulatory protein
MKHFLMAVGALCFCIGAPAGIAQDKPGAIVTEVTETVVTVTAVDQQARTVTVQGQNGGDPVTIKVPPQAQNLDQVFPGSRFRLRYLESVAVFISPTGGTPSANVGTSMELAPKGANPEGIISEVVEVQARVDAIDYNERSVVLTGPKGNSLKLKVDESVKRLNEVKVGDIVVVGYTQALAYEMIRDTK